MRVANLNLSVGKTGVTRSHQILRDINFEFVEGSSIAIVGNSGSGKTTLLNGLIKIFPVNAHVSGIINVEEFGDILMAEDREVRRYRKENVSYLPQDHFSIFVPNLSIGKQLERIYRYKSGIDENSILETISARLRSVGLEPAAVLGLRSSELSGGMLMRCAWVAATASSAPSMRLMLLDEPTSNLDGVSAAKLLDNIQQISNLRRCSVCVATHDIRLAKRFDNVLVLKNGMVQEFGPTNEFFSNPSSEEGRLLRENWDRLGN